jgi:hypothetical protein
MTIERFIRDAGSNLFVGKDDPRMCLADTGEIPDWVKVPEETGHGGLCRCLAITVGPCPIDGHTEECRHFILDGPVSCVECVINKQFLWYRSTHNNRGDK